MRLLYTSDLHGNSSLYEAMLDMALQRQVEAVIVGGDLLPHAIKLDRAIATQRDFVSQQLRPLLEQFRRTAPSTNIYLLPGNDDWAAGIAALDELERDGLIDTLHERVYALAAASPSAPAFLAGYGCVPITPFSIKDYERRDEGQLPGYSFAMSYVSLARLQATLAQGAGKEAPAALERPRPTTLAELAAQPSIAEGLVALAQHSPPGQTIYVCHTPPHNTALDTSLNRHLGSLALRSFIEQHQPPLTLHGHIHEAPAQSGRYAEQIGRTWCMNPGSDGRRLHAILLDSEDLVGTTWHSIYGELRIEN